MQGNWIKIDQKGAGPGARSSHAVAVVSGKLYAFGGEFTPRVPVDNHVHVFDLETKTWSVAEVKGDVPPPRVGVRMVAVGETVYVFGGRDESHKELNEMYSFDTGTGVWTLISSGDDGPPHRSYHSMTADNECVYIFGGCGVTGRLNDLWVFEVGGRKWSQYPLPGENLRGRGGMGLVVIRGKVWVIYGFAGMELDDVHCFDPVRLEWAKVETAGEKPTSRSVFSTVGTGKYIFICGGEVDPSDLGHLGAGKFSVDSYVLDTETLDWARVDDGVGSDGHPGPRGWCAFASCRVGRKPGLLVYGGNSPSNDRLDDMYFFTPITDV